GSAIHLDGGILDPARLIRAPELAKLSLDARIEVVLVHEFGEYNFIKVNNLIEASEATHFAAVKGGPLTTLKISQEAREYLKYWAAKSVEAGKGLPIP